MVFCSCVQSVENQNLLEKNRQTIEPCSFSYDSLSTKNVSVIYISGSRNNPPEYITVSIVDTIIGGKHLLMSHFKSDYRDYFSISYGE
jgi:hypothetical protein